MEILTQTVLNIMTNIVSYYICKWLDEKHSNIQVTGIYSKLWIDYLPIEEAEKLKEKILSERSKYNIEY